ncbi:MAG TPA: hypothetical protein VGZ27_20260 [Vicinamibacterales bacterium]|nr:hypothetical protein [Vicinamibacterales bacterium]
MRLRDAICGAMVLSALAPAGARAQQRPLVTEDPETVGVNRVLVEGGMEFDRDQLYSAYGLKGDTTHGPTFGVSVGLGPSTEIHVDAGLLQRLHVNTRTPAPLSQVLDFTTGTSSSLEDFTVATKIRLAGEHEGHPAFGVRFGTKLPTARRESGMGLGTTDFFAAFLVGKTVESVRTVGNVGLLVLGNPISAQQPVRALALGLSVARALTNDFEVVGEVNGHLDPMGPAPPPGTEGRGILRLAGRYTHGLLRLDLGILVGITPRDPAFGISAGATYVIGK